jgi:hypothetical protein
MKIREDERKLIHIYTQCLKIHGTIQQYTVKLR